MATKLHDGIAEKVEAASLVTIMSASNIFGRGFSEKKLELIMDAYPTVLLTKESDAQKIAKITQIKGMAEKSAEAFVEKIPDFIQFIKDAGLVKKLAPEKKKEVDAAHPLFGKSIVMTGFRDADLQNRLKEVGAKLGSSVSKNTFILLVKDSLAGEDTGKAAEARKLGIQIMTPQQFIEKYF
jgi:NAD-dependent DNA ligase